MFVFTLLAQERWKRRFSGLEWGMLAGSDAGIGTRTRTEGKGSETVWEPNHKKTQILA